MAEEVDTNTTSAHKGHEVSAESSDKQGDHAVEDGEPSSPSTLSSPEAETKLEDQDIETKEVPTRPELQRQESRADRFGKWRIVAIMFSLCMALFLAALDVTIISTALPTIAQHFKASSSGYLWVGSSYLLANAAATPIWGKISDIWGRKPVLILANATFMIGSLISAVAVSIGMLVGGRVVQGLGGGGLIILVNICIGDLFSMRDRPKYYAIVGATWAIASGVGPVIGGAFTESVSWRWCFYINLPLDGLSLVLLIFFLKLDTPRTPFFAGIKAIDALGGLAIIGGVICFLYGMESGGNTHPWDSAFVLCLIIFGVVLVVLFFIIEWKVAKYPIMPLRIFEDHSNIASLGVCFCQGMVFIAQSYYLPLYFQTVLRLTPILSGVTLFALVIPLSIGSMAAGITMKKIGRYKEIITASMSILCLGTGLLIDLPSHRDWVKVIIYQVIAGFGTGPLFQGPLIALQAHLKGYDIAVGTATYGFTRNISTALSVVIGGVIFQNELLKRRGALEQVLGPKAGEFVSSGFGSTAAQIRDLPAVQQQALASAYTSSFRTMWIFYTAFAAFGIVVSLFITRKELSKIHEKTKTGIEEQERVRKEEKELRKQRKLAAGGNIPKDVEGANVSPNAK